MTTLSLFDQFNPAHPYYFDRSPFDEPSITPPSGSVSAPLLALFKDASLLRYTTAEIPSAGHYTALRNGITTKLFTTSTPINSGQRCELTLNVPYEDGDVIEYEWKIMIGSVFTPDPSNRWYLMGQFHDQPDQDLGQTWGNYPGASPLEYFAYGNVSGQHYLAMSHSGVISTNPAEWVKLTTDQWVGIKLRIRWSQDANKGWMQLYQDGILIMTRTGANMANAAEMYLKLGQYRHNSFLQNCDVSYRDVYVRKITNVNIMPRSFTLKTGGDGLARSYDKDGRFFRGTPIASTGAPTLSLATTPDQNLAKGSTYTAIFNSNQPCDWKMHYPPSDDAVKTLSNNGQRCTITWTIPAGERGGSRYCGVYAENENGNAEIFDRVHIAVPSVRKVGSGELYATRDAACVGAPNGSTIILKSGTYTSVDNFVHNSGNILPNGIFTTYTDGSGNTRYTVTGMTTYMAEFPSTAIMNGQNTNRPFLIDGNHGYEAELIAFGAAGNGGFDGTPGASISRVGLDIIGFHVINSPSEAAQCIWSRFIKFAHITGVIEAPATYGINTLRSADIVYENCFFTGNMRGALGAYKCLRGIMRRNICVHQHNTCVEPRQGFAIYECRNFRQFNNIDIDSAGAHNWWINSGVKTASYGFPESDYSTNGIIPDLSLNVQSGRNLGMKNNYGLITVGAWENLPYNTAHTFTDFVGSDLDLYDAGYSAIDDGVHITGLTLSGVRNNSSLNSGTQANFHQDYRNPQTISNAIYNLMGRNGSTPVNQGCVFNGEHVGGQPSILNNFLIANTVGPEKNPGGLFTISNQRTSTDLKADGLKYLTRIESGSRFDGLNLGCKDVFKINGKKNTFWGDAGYNVDVDKSWLEYCDYAKYAEILRAFSVNAMTQSSGMQTLSGNRGFAANDKNLFEYIATNPIEGMSTPTQYPYEFSHSVEAGVLKLFLKRYASSTATNITKHKVYIDGRHAQDIQYNSAVGMEVFELEAGKTYEIKLTAVDSVKGESAFSKPLLVAA